MELAAERLRIVIPMTLFMIFLLLYLNFGNVAAPAVVMLSVPFALIGGFWLVYWYGFNISVAVAVGFIALAGVAVETGDGLPRAAGGSESARERGSIHPKASVCETRPASAACRHDPR